MREKYCNNCERLLQNNARLTEELASLKLTAENYRAKMAETEDRLKQWLSLEGYAEGWRDIEKIVDELEAMYLHDEARSALSEGAGGE